MSRSDGLLRRVRRLEERVGFLERMPRLGGAAHSGEATAVRYEDLPNSISKSLQAMQALGEADATTVSQKTGRNRSVETIYLNQLVRLGILTRTKVGKKVFFRFAKVY